jgi:hypothetical protein
MHAVPQAGPSAGDACAAVLAQPTLVDAIRARIAGRLDALAFTSVFAPRDTFAPDFTRASPLTDEGAAELAAVMAASGQVTGLYLSFASALGNAGVAHIARFCSLRSLDLTGTLNLNSDGASFLRHLSKLTSLGLAYTPIDDAGLAVVAASLTSLKRLDLLGCDGITAAGIGQLSLLIRLTSLRTPRAEETMAWRQAGMSEARALNPVLRSLPALERLAAASGEMACLALAGRLPSLRRLELQKCDVADLRLLPFTMPGLTQLSLGFRKDTYLTAADTSVLAHGLPALHSLSLGHVDTTTVKRSALAELGALSALRSLTINITGGEEEEEGASQLLEAALPRLSAFTHLSITGIACDADLAAVCRHLAPSLASLSLDSVGVSDQGATELSRLVGLTRLQFLVSRHPHDSEHAPVPALPKLQWLSMMGACSDASFLAALTGLTYLDLLYPSPTILAELPALKNTLLQLSLRRVRGPTDACCAHIASLTRLTRLNYEEGEASRRLSDKGFVTPDGPPRAALRVAAVRYADGRDARGAGGSAHGALAAAHLLPPHCRARLPGRRVGGARLGAAGAAWLPHDDRRGGRGRDVPRWPRCGSRSNSARLQALGVTDARSRCKVG